MAICPTCMTKYPDAVATCAADGTGLVPDSAFAFVDKELAPGDVVGEYRIEGKLGEGGFGAVFRAVHPVIGKHAAIKVLSRQFSANPQMVSRFIAEARAVNQIRHRNIIDIFAFGQLADGRQYYIMELLDGATFDSYLASNKRLTIAQALPILRGIARALDAAHGKGILHRDLKPENVYLVFDEDGGVQAKLLDFGLVKLLADGSGSGGDSGEGQHKTKTGTPMGTPYYMSPEQCRGKPVDRGTDIYAFGALVFEVLTGEVPFNGDSPMDVLLKHITQEPPRASERCPAVPPELDGPILCMLAKESSARPASAGEALELLIAAGTVAGALTASVPLPLPSNPIVTGATVTGPTMTMGGETQPQGVRVITGADVSPMGNTFLASEADVARDAAGGGRSRTKFGVIAALVAVAALVVGAGVVVSVTRGTRGPAPSGIVAPPASATLSATVAPSATTATSATAAPKSEDVEVRIEGAPKDAKVMTGARELGVAPGPFTMKAGAPVTITVSAKGYKSKELTFTPTSNEPVQVALEKQAGPAVKTGQKAIPSDLEGFDKK